MDRRKSRCLKIMTIRLIILYFWNVLMKEALHYSESSVSGNHHTTLNTSYVLQYDLCCARHAIVAALTPGTNCSQGLASPSAARPTIEYFLPLLLDIFTAVWENLTDLYGNEQ